MAFHATLATTLLALCLAPLPEIAEAQQIEQIASPSGVTINYVKCSRKSGKCLNKAADFCSGSYQVIDSESHSGGIIADILPGPVTWFSMTFLCGKSDGAMPSFAFRGPEPAMPSVIIPSTIQTTCNNFGNTVTCTTR